MTDPSAQLREPEIGQYVDPAEISGPVASVATLDIGGIVLWVLGRFGVHPDDIIAKWLAGDWQAVARAASALGHLADYLEAESAQIGRDLGTLDANWRGNAADGATSYFTSYAKAVEDPVGDIRAAAGQITEFSEGMHGLVIVIKDIYNEAVGAMINALASLWFPPLAAWRAYQAGRGLVRVIDKINKAMTIVSKFAATLSALKLDAAGKILAIDAPALTTPYQNPAYTPQPMSASEL